MTSEPDSSDKIAQAIEEDRKYAARRALFIEGNWRHDAARAIYELSIADEVTASRLHELCMALREGLTPEQQRTVAQDLLGEPHVSMIMARAGQLVSVGVKVLVPARRARSLVGGAGGHLYPDDADPWWDK